MYLDSTGKAITEPIYDEALDFNGGLASVSRNKLYGYINTSGQVVITIHFTNAHNFSEGLAPAESDNGLWGYIDTKGNWVITPMYAYADIFTNGEARVMKDEKLIYIDKKNNKLHD
jgi:hypothetical protein